MAGAGPAACAPAWSCRSQTRRRGRALRPAARRGSRRRRRRVRARRSIPADTRKVRLTLRASRRGCPPCCRWGGGGRHATATGRRGRNGAAEVAVPDAAHVMAIGAGLQWHGSGAAGVDGVGAASRKVAAADLADERRDQARNGAQRCAAARAAGHGECRPEGRAYRGARARRRRPAALPVSTT